MLLGSWSLSRVLIREDPAVCVRRRGEEETLEDRWAVAMMKIMSLLESSNWETLSDRDREATVCSGVTCGQGR